MVYKLPECFYKGEICFDVSSTDACSELSEAVHTDGRCQRGVGAGAVLMQFDSDEIEYPICYFSHKFNQRQKNYSTIEKETLALVLSLQHFDVYLSTTKYPILVYTDHNPLVFINKMKNHNQRLLRWGLLLQGYNLDIRHIKGKENFIVDALSRTEVPGVK